MRSRTRWPAALLAGLVASLLATDVGLAGPVGEPAEPDLTELLPAEAAGVGSTVTLLTGDRVLALGEGKLSVVAGPGRDHIAFATHQAGEHQYVIPSDALPLLAAGRLDHRLFNVTLLQEYGYHDQRPDLPLIVAGEVGGAPSVATGVFSAAAGAEIAQALPAIGGAAVRLDKSSAAGFWAELTGGDEVLRTHAAGMPAVWLDGLRQPLLDQSVPQIGAPAAYELGLDGSGVRVAVLDTGIDAEHPDLAGRIAAQANFTDGWEDDRDLVGHGTHVAGIIAGSGAASDGRLHGVATGAELLDAKVCAEFCQESWIIAGMQWAAEQGAAVVNVSLGGDAFPDDPLEAAVDQLTDEFGMLFVIAAGNDGEFGITSPATAASALAVGAVDREDELAGFSSLGPLRDGELKPDLTAPGVDIVAANSQDGFLGVPGEPYVALSGTSMAAPHAAGAAALLVQQHPQWSPAELKAALTGSAAPHPDLPATGQGAGRLDLARAVTQPVMTSPASVSFVRQQWPHEGNKPETRTVTYRNHGDQDLTLDLTVTATGPERSPAPAEMFTLDVTTVEVPAGGAAQVALTVDASVPAPGGYYSGRVVATSGGVTVQTAFGVDREAEHFDVTFSHRDRTGELTSDYSTILGSLDENRFISVFGAAETTVRLPAGDYALGSWVFTPTSDADPDLTLLSQLRLEVDRDLVVPIDARLGEPLTLSVPDRRAQPFATGVVLEVNPALLAFSTTWRAGQLYTAQLDPGQRMTGVDTHVGGTLIVPGPDGSVATAPVSYRLAYYLHDQFSTGFERAAQARDLAQIRIDPARQVDGSELWLGRLPVVPDRPMFEQTGALLPVESPLVRTEMVNTDGGVWWEGFLFEDLVTDDGFEELVMLVIDDTRYEPGEPYDERWNYAVFGPQAGGVLRVGGDVLLVSPNLYGDAAGHWGSVASEQTITISRDGEQIAKEDSSFVTVQLPPGEADYRVEIAATRVGSAPLSTHTDVVWEFRSGDVEEFLWFEPTPAVRFSPPLAADNTARAGRPLLVPVQVQRPDQGGDGPTDLQVEVSYDDGQTWQAAPVVANRFVLLHHPEEAGFVSLRAHAAAGGGTVEQTTIRAYQIVH